eukprot:scaffold17707_cov57-Phaeocystis_antarctica.AAC.3
MVGDDGARLPLALMARERTALAAALHLHGTPMARAPWHLHGRTSHQLCTNHQLRHGRLAWRHLGRRLNSSLPLGSLGIRSTSTARAGAALPELHLHGRLVWRGRLPAPPLARPLGVADGRLHLGGEEAESAHL